VQIEVDRDKQLLKRSAAAQRDLDSWTAQLRCRQRIHPSPLDTMRERTAGGDLLEN